MSWVKIDDQFYDHPKVIKAGRDGRDLFLTGLCHCAAQLTDGFIDTDMLPLLAFKAGVSAAKKAAAILVSVGLWETVDGGYQVHDYLEYNPSGDKVRAERAAAKERMSRNRSGERSPQSQSKKQDCSGEQSTKNNGTSGDVRPTPSPSPSPAYPPSGGEAAAATRTPAGGTPMPLPAALPPSKPKRSSREEERERRQQRIQALLAEHPHWEPVLLQRITEAGTISDKLAYCETIVTGWERGDGTPAEPLLAGSPSRAAPPNGLNGSHGEAREGQVAQLLREGDGF